MHQKKTSFSKICIFRRTVSLAILLMKLWRSCTEFSGMCYLLFGDQSWRIRSYDSMPMTFFCNVFLSLRFRPISPRSTKRWRLKLKSLSMKYRDIHENPVLVCLHSLSTGHVISSIISNRGINTMNISVLYYKNWKFHTQILHPFYNTLRLLVVKNNNNGL